MSKERLLATGLDKGRNLSSGLSGNYHCLKAIEIKSTINQKFFSSDLKKTASMCERQSHKCFDSDQFKDDNQSHHCFNATST